MNSQLAGGGGNRGITNNVKYDTLESATYKVL